MLFEQRHKNIPEWKTAEGNLTSHDVVRKVVGGHSAAFSTVNGVLAAG
jgi:hypothetical protein